VNSLWGRIGLGALAVFLVGMLGITLAGQARTAAASALREIRGVAPAPVELAFRLDGEPVGWIRRLSLRRPVRGEVPDVDLEVELTREAVMPRLDRCDLTPAGQDQFDFDRGFRCLRPGSPGFIPVGQARFRPGDFSRQLWVAERFEGDLRDGDPFEATADMGGDIRVVARGGGGNGALVRVRADSGGASIRVNDAMGRALLRLLADSTGAMLRIRGKDGRDVVRLDAGGGGFALTVDTTGVE